MTSPKKIPPPVEAAHPPATPPPKPTKREEPTEEGHEHKEHTIPMTPPTSPGYLSPTFSSEQHAFKGHPHICTRCHPECLGHEDEEPCTPSKPYLRRRSSVGSHHHDHPHLEPVTHHLGMAEKC